MLSIIPVLVVALSVYTMSALAWFSSSIVEKPMEIASGQYVSQVEIVKEETGLINDDNLIGESHKTSSFLNENIDLSGLGTTKQHISLSPIIMKTNRIPVRLLTLMWIAALIISPSSMSWN